jgi:hypothetical protein
MKKQEIIYIATVSISLKITDIYIYILTIGIVR